MIGRDANIRIRVSKSLKEKLRKLAAAAKPPSNLSNYVRYVLEEHVKKILGKKQD